MERLMNALYVADLSEELRPIGAYLVHDMLVSQSELISLRQEQADPPNEEEGEFLDSLRPLLEKALTDSGANRDEVEEAALSEEYSRESFLQDQIDHHLTRSRRCRDLLIELEQGKLTNCLAYFEEFVGYRERVHCELNKVLPNREEPPAARELRETVDKTLQTFIALLKSKTTPAPT